MTKNETLHIRVNGTVKSNAEKTLNVLGLSLSEAVNMFLHQIPLVGGLPFEIKVPIAPESLIVHDSDDLYQKLQAGMEQVKAGKVADADDVMKRVRRKHGLQG